MPAKPKVQFHSLAVQFTLRHRARLKLFIERLCKKEGKRISSLTYVFCSDKYLLELNKKFLKHGDLTDILTFDLSETSGIVGEIYISVERVRENARAFNTPFTTELHRVIFHGALHLCGYRDKTKRDQTVIRRNEDAYLAAYGLKL